MDPSLLALLKEVDAQHERVRDGSTSGLKELLTGAERAYEVLA
jgi:hypothetical protein